MDNLRWILLIVGVAIVVLVYVLSRFELWQKIGGLKQGLGKNDSLGSSNYQPPPRREPVAFEAGEETIFDDEREFDFGDHEHADENHHEWRTPGDFAHDGRNEDSPAKENSVAAKPETPTGADPKATGVVHEPFASEYPATESAVNITLRDAPPNEVVEEYQEDTDEGVDLDLAALAQDDAPASISVEELEALGIEPMVLVLTVMARQGERIHGPALLSALEQEGFEFGEMEIFHYYYEAKSPALFGVVNVVEPGVFDLSAMSHFSTPGITLYCQVPGVLSPETSFEKMLACARNLAGHLQASVCDDKRNPLTEQAIGHYRDQARDFNRKLLLAMRSSLGR